MGIGVTEEHQQLHASVRGWAAQHVGRPALRAAADPADGAESTLPACWSDMAALGLFGLHLPEEVGGAGYSLVELSVVLEELGRALLPGPFLPTVLASAVLHRAGRTDLLAGFADGSVVGAVGLNGGSLRLERSDGGELLLSGESGPILGGDLAAVFVLPVTDQTGATSWVVVDRADVTPIPVPTYDLTRRAARVRAASTVLPAGALLDLDTQEPYDLAATFCAAELSGVAGWCVSTAAEYAKVRTQFGRPIGQFQGVKHRCARMLVSATQTQVCAWDAAVAAADRSVDSLEASFAAAVAGALAPTLTYEIAKDCIQTLGGIGYTWEHDAHLYLRRAHSLRLALGPAAAWQRRVARLALDGVRRTLRVELPPQAEQIRGVVRAELAPARDLPDAQRLDYLGRHGYAAPHLPEPWGKAADAVAQLVIAEELRRAELEPANMIIGNWVVPTLLAHGNEQQHQQFIPPTLAGRLVWCQLFSEPGAGSDLAALSTRAEKVDGGWRLSGQKVWTSKAHEADWGICLARTDATLPKHRGLSYFLVDMRSPGITVRPLREITGESLFNEVWLDGVFVPDDQLVGKPGEGWKLARTTLSNERVALSGGAGLSPAVEGLIELVGKRQGAPNCDPDEHAESQLGVILADAQTAALIVFRQVLRSVAGLEPGAESSVLKLVGVQNGQQVWDFALETLGDEALEVDSSPNSPIRQLLRSRCHSIAGGTTDVQLNIIGERLLGLPRDPEPSGTSA